MSTIDPDHLKNGLHVYVSCVSWEVPEGDQLHKFNLAHDYIDDIIQMDKNGEDVTGLKSTNANPEKLSFKFGKMQLDVHMVHLYEDHIYALDVNGKSLKRYKEAYYQWFNVWKVTVDGVDWRIVLDKTALEVWGNGEKLEDAKMTFAENGGAVCNFVLGGSAKCKIEGHGDKKTGITHTLLVNGNQVPLDINLDEPLYRRYDLYKAKSHSYGFY